MDAEFDYLIVSDSHLRDGFDNPTEGLYHFDEEFAGFLRYYRLNRASDHPWSGCCGSRFRAACRSSVKHALDADVLVDVRPVHTLAGANKSEVRALCCSCLSESP
jgi:hypothetical protein